jgi:type II secretory pathway pseudopilin PulG
MNTDQKLFNLRNMAVLAAILVIAAFLLGFVPQYRQASGLRDELRVRDQRITQLESAARLARARELANLLYLELTRKNYGLAGQHATALFDHLRGMNGGDSNQYRGTLEKLLTQRDAVTASIAKSDPAAVNLVQNMLDQLNQLGNP